MSIVKYPESHYVTVLDMCMITSDVSFGVVL